MVCELEHRRPEKSTLRWAISGAVEARLSQLRIFLGRPLFSAEREMVEFSLLCDRCLHVPNEWESVQICDRCHTGVWCDAEHRTLDSERHELACPQLAFCYLCDLQGAKEGSIAQGLPPLVDKQFQDISTQNFEELMKAQIFVNLPPSPLEIDRVQLAFLSDILSYPLTIMYALWDFKKFLGAAELSEVRHLSIHLVGKILGQESAGTRKYEYLMHRLPKLRSMTVVMVGPDLQLPESSTPGNLHYSHTESLCKECVGRSLTVHQAKMTYDVFSKYTTAPTICL